MWFLSLLASALAAGGSLFAATNAFRGGVNVRDFGAAGDGQTLDTAAIGRAIDACAAQGGGSVLFPAGRYLSGTVGLRSHVALHFDSGATLVGTTNLGHYRQPLPPSFMPEARWGKWHRALILGEDVQDVTISGSGVLDGNKVFDPTGEERMRGPHTIVLVNCRRITIRDVSIRDSANYAVFFQVSDDIDLRNLHIVGGWDGVHFRGAPDRPCRNVSIVNCQMFTGDDSIAGRYWDRALISGCILNSSCNPVRVIGPVQHVVIHDCLLYGPGLQPHRSSNRTNALAGINLQPGAWDATQGCLDDVLISDVTMHNVATPFHFSLKPGNTAGRIVVDRVAATGVYRSASSVESWAETPFTNVVFRDLTIECKGGGTREQGRQRVQSPGVDARPLPAWGFYARHVKNLTLDNVRLRLQSDDLRPVMICDRVEQLSLDGFRFTQSEGAEKPLVLNEVGRALIQNSEVTSDNQ